MLLRVGYLQPRGVEVPPIDLPPPPTGLTQEQCQTANSQAWLGVAGYSLGALVLALALFALLHKKLVGGHWGRVVSASIFAAVVGGLLVGLDPARGDTFQRCLTHTELVRYVTLGEMPLARALAMGAAPAGLVAALACVLYSRAR